MIPFQTLFIVRGRQRAPCNTAPPSLVCPPPRVPSWILQAMQHELKIRAGELPSQDVYQLSPSDVKQLLLDVLQPQISSRYTTTHNYTPLHTTTHYYTQLHTTTHHYTQLLHTATRKYALLTPLAPLHTTTNHYHHYTPGAEWRTKSQRENSDWPGPPPALHQVCAFGEDLTKYEI